MLLIEKTVCSDQEAACKQMTQLPKQQLFASPSTTRESPACVYENWFERSPIGEYLLSPTDDPVILAVNDAFLRACGRTREALVGEHLFIAFAGNPNDQHDTGVAALRASLRRVIETGLPDSLPLQRYPIRITQPDGSARYEERFWHAINTPIFDSDDNLICIAHRTEDVTIPTRVAAALQRSTERQAFQLAVADGLRFLNSPEDIAGTSCALIGARLQITRVAYVEVDDLAGTFVQRQWVSGLGPQPPTQPRRLSDFGEDIISTLRGGKPLIIEDVLTDPRTAPYASAYNSIGVRSNLAIPLVKSGHLTLVLSLQHEQPRSWSEAEIELATDVAERSWAAAENTRAQEALREANRRKDEFLAMLAHELRNPLAPIRTAADLLARGSLNEALLRHTSEVLARQVGHMTALVDDLLDVSRVTRGLVTLARAPQDMKTVVANAMEQVRSLFERNRQHVALELPPSSAIVYGDGKRLVQVMVNLLSNAAKYTPAGGHIKLTMAVDQEQVRVHVQDDGIGIPVDLQPRIFDLFTQAERSADRTQGGLGLGLALVRSLVELHDGRVSVFSEGPGAGSCFTVHLPHWTAHEVPADDDRSPISVATAQHLNILLIDDNVDAADMLRSLLEAEGHRVRVEHNPMKAVNTALADPPQAAIIDIGLPGMDGYELVQRLRAERATAQGTYIALTGYGQPADRSRAFEAGFDEHLIKPADPARILSLLARVRPV